MEIKPGEHGKDVKIQKNIGRIFRQYNIIEYKSPEDNLDIDDFYKVYAYACIYKSALNYSVFKEQ